MNIIINPRSEAQLSSIKNDLPHALLLAGERGVGLATVARGIAGRDVAGFIEPLDSKGQVNTETGTISVEVIRRLYDQTRTKQTGRQIMIVDDADRMSLGAQAAFLKLLEEPNEGTHFILTSHSPQLLLPTIRSRVQSITLHPITGEQTKQLLLDIGIADTRTKTQLEYLATGLPAELRRLTSDEEYFKQRAEIMTDTRTFLTSSPYERLLVVHKYQKERSKALQLLDSALAVSRRTLSTKPQKNITYQLEALLKTREKIEANCNTRLQLMAFVVQ